MWRFDNIKDSGWWLRVSGVDELLEYMELTEGKCSDIFMRGLIDNKKNKMIEGAEVFARKHDVTLLEGYNLMRQGFNISRMESIHDKGFIFLNSAGGHNTVWDDEDVLATVYRKKLVYPDYKKEDIVITSWGNEYKGTHCYAKIGSTEVRDGNKIKWNTRDEAYQNALRYLQEDE